jgi:GNAT superfamily N-acetyltransferase
VAFAVRRLAPGDEPAFLRYTQRDHLFEADPRRATPSAPLSPAGAGAFLSDPSVLFWLAEADEDGEAVGMLLCHVLRRSVDGPWAELLLYEIGTHVDWRRRGVGRALLAAMEAWMREHGVVDVWVPAEDAAVAFYAACGLVAGEGVVMVKQVGGSPRPGMTWLYLAE